MALTFRQRVQSVLQGSIPTVSNKWHFVLQLDPEGGVDPLNIELGGMFSG